ncbi:MULTISPECIES: alpha/beta hydrolase [unclassified Mycobacterium]|uniref:alpha/beta fold hydrolase n=1 Tax=unclassified Mycobacterium TaxID=2642494 RepID=UPI0029C88E28|nr:MULTISPECIES: alpha/beta hydrolase [unclassified Mycobacterium]
MSWRDSRLGVAKDVRLSSGLIRYHECGSGPALVFVHGYLVNANIWRKVVPHLADDFHCVTPDWPLGSHDIPMERDADLSPLGIARLIAELIAALDLRDVTLVGNDSGGAYCQIAAAESPPRVSRLVLASCETPDCTWPPTPGGFGLLKATAAYPATYRALYQVLRLQRSWRWRNTYGWLAKYPIDAPAMNGYIRPVLDRREIRFDGRKAIGSVNASYSRAAAIRLPNDFRSPVLLLWATEDHVFPVEHARRYAQTLGGELHTIDDSYTYLSEDQPERFADELRSWLTS